MADIEFTCPNCDQVLEAADDLAGESIECPSCNTEIAVPGGAAGDDAGKECPNCGALMDDDAVLCVECGFHTRMGRQIETDMS